MSLSRRAFVQTSAFTLAATRLPKPSSNSAIEAARRTALANLTANVRTLPQRAEGYDQPVLIEGSTYLGIWQECAPHEGLVWSQIASHADSTPTPMETARNNHLAFFALQRHDGQLPSAIKLTETGYAVIQMVVPIAATAWELAQSPNFPDAHHFLEIAYAACSNWDAWLRRYRDTRKTGLVEGFCCFDTGHDNSPRWAGIPNRCPDSDARKCPPIPTLPRLCPDLSATVFGARKALAAMARTLNKPDEESRWLEDAEQIRRLILTKLYSEEDAAFYDLDAQDNFVRVRSDVISRVLGEHVLDITQSADRRIFDALWTRQLHNPAAFWAPYPLTSIAQNDPVFVRPIPRNSWGGATQALTALRAPRWMTHYGKEADLDHLMHQWIEALTRAHTAEPTSAAFRQQMDPITGVFTLPDPGGYSPAALVFLDFHRRLGLKRA